MHSPPCDCKGGDAACAGSHEFRSSVGILVAMASTAGTRAAGTRARFAHPWPALVPAADAPSPPGCRPRRDQELGPWESSASRVATLRSGGGMRVSCDWWRILRHRDPEAALMRVTRRPAPVPIFTPGALETGRASSGSAG